MKSIQGKRNFRHHGLLALPIILMTAGVTSAAGITSPVISNQPGITVRVALSPEAEKALIQGHEYVIVSASWYGWPTPQFRKYAGEDGQLWLGGTSVSLPAQGGVAHFPPSHLKAERIGWLKGPVYINVNVYSARNTWANNVLVCGIVDDTLKQVAAHPVTLHCSLIRTRQATR